MDESAFHFCGRLILTTTVFHFSWVHSASFWWFRDPFNRGMGELTHTEKVCNTTRGCRLCDVKNSVNFHNKNFVKFLSNQKLSTKPAHLHLSFRTFLIKFIFISFLLFCNFTSLAYDIFYTRKVNLFDKIKEVVFSQLFPCVEPSFAS
jgi:hypothetical protein